MVTQFDEQEAQKKLLKIKEEIEFESTLEKMIRHDPIVKANGGDRMLAKERRHIYNHAHQHDEEREERAMA